jgi:hypothetical protein
MLLLLQTGGAQVQAADTWQGYRLSYQVSSGSSKSVMLHIYQPSSPAAAAQQGFAAGT